MLGSLTIVVAHHMYSMPPYPYLATDYGTQLSLFTHHMWIGGFLIVGDAVHAAIFMVRDYDPTTRYNDLLDRVLRHRDAIISHLNWVCIFLGFHSFGLYIHNDTMSALGRPQDMFSDTAIQLQPVFAQWIQNTHALAPNTTAPGATTSTSLTWGGGDLVAVGGKVALLLIPLGTADFLVHHIHAFTIHVTVLILLKGVLFARSSRLIPDKANLGFRFPCDGPGRGGTCQVSAWNHVFLGLFWMYNAISVVIFHFSWKMQSDVWGTISDQWVNTDAAFHRETGTAATAIIVRDWQEKIITGTTTRFTTILAITAEAQAYREALILIKNLQIGNCIIETDCLPLVQAIKAITPIADADAIIRDILQLLDEAPDVGATWTPRKGNKVAHQLAALAAGNELRRQWIFDPPNQIRNTIRIEAGFAILQQNQRMHKQVKGVYQLSRAPIREWAT
ncbi:hypothetical protein Ahy_B05g074062 [Arachis hypogaea]|uniref:photosystem I n=1 Tax=Arachis hypogaea TaxID=3818 RepID=A0A444YY66_ARAHY|nr:hypothetical protein Ahy_B05g074062 [Arachis hypogaea]